MSQIELVVEELKQLPPAKLQHVAELVHRMHEAQRDERQRALAETAGCMTPAEADAFHHSIDEACERIDAEQDGSLD